MRWRMAPTNRILLRLHWARSSQRFGWAGNVTETSLSQRMWRSPYQRLATLSGRLQRWPLLFRRGYPPPIRRSRSLQIIPQIRQALVTKLFPLLFLPRKKMRLSLQPPVRNRSFHFEKHISTCCANWSIVACDTFDFCPLCRFHGSGSSLSH